MIEYVNWVKLWVVFY